MDKDQRIFELETQNEALRQALKSQLRIVARHQDLQDKIKRAATTGDLHPHQRFHMIKSILGM